MIPLREQHRRDTRRHIVAAARDLFGSAGFATTTMEAVAERAGVSRATLFNYFPTKQSLLLPFAAHVMRTRVRPEVEAALDPWPGLLPALAATFDSVDRHIFSLPDLRGGLREAVVAEARQPREPEEPDEPGGGLIREVLERAAARGELRTDVPLADQARFVNLLLISDQLARGHEKGGSTPAPPHRDQLLRFLEPALTGSPRRADSDVIL